ncbi:excreted virulence factor EspC (type VII ESX diderm) [Amycolatopsis sulphurea]|uniref:Excreted virulence factor EspC (Type VII ESX diderm) n=1 Tax=Amycolatopsis sulphurea TaxID=76022 RepID=A0A2A9FK37_9PSEU|nr:type VII secretion target [Amycolatopsis sulphurea]PFG50922.1 excreted virulence factor EspC (type VII ESX diderm) [Amycolatopsis sulphurea]
MSGNGGYTASTQAMSDASKKLTRYAQDLLDGNPDLATPAVAEKDFGNAHTAHAKQYLDGAKNLSEAVTGYQAKLAELGTKLTSGAKAYDDNEYDQSGQIDQAGTL